MFETVEEVAAGLARAKYLTTPTTHQHVLVAAKQHKALLVEGPPGSGKSEIALAVAQAAGTDCVRLQCYEGIDEDKAIGKFDTALQRLYLGSQKRLADQGWEGLKKRLHSLDFFSAGPLLEALLYETKPCVLLIDEVDKVSHAFEALLLEILSAWQLSIPKLGTIQARQIPFVVLSSNQERPLGNPLRSRCLYLRFEYPSPELETRILRAKCGSRHAVQIAGLARAMRTFALEKAPSIREMIDLAEAMRLLGLERLTPDLRDILLPVLAKTQSDRKRLLLPEQFDVLIKESQRYARDIQDHQEVRP